MTKTLQIRDGDFVISSASGRAVFIEGKAKAEQSVRRLLNLDAPEGADLSNIIGRVPESPFALSAAVQQDIRRAFDELVSAQRGGQLAERTAEERLSNIARMFVVPARIGGAVSSTGYAVRVDVVTVAGRSITVGFQGTAPQGG